MHGLCRLDILIVDQNISSYLGDLWVKNNITSRFLLIVLMSNKNKNNK